MIFNKKHRNYKKDNCLFQMVKMSKRLRDSFHQEVKSCFPDPFHEAVTINGSFYGSGYLPWGDPKPGLGMQYHLAEAQSCQDQPVIAALSAPKEYSWCRSCPEELAFLMLQGMTAVGPGNLRAWIDLANFLACSAMDSNGLRLALGCLAISFRMIRCSGMDPEHTSWSNMQPFVTCAYERFNVEFITTRQMIRSIETQVFAQESNVINTVRGAMTSHTTEHYPHPLMSESRIMSFVKMLQDCPVDGGMSFVGW